MLKPDLQLLLKQLNDLENSLPKDETLSLVNQIIDDKYKSVSSKLKDDVSLQGLDNINNKLDKFKQDFNLEPLISSIESIQSELAQFKESIAGQFNENTQASDFTKNELLGLITTTKDELQGKTGKEIGDVLAKITGLEKQLSYQDDTSKVEGQTLKSVIAGLEKKLSDLGVQNKVFVDSSNKSVQETDTKFTKQQLSISALTDKLDAFRKEMIHRFSNLGGGSMNRQIFISGADPLTRYTDINLKPGAGTTITYINNDTTKKVDITITGGGSGSGITRSVATATVSSTVGAVASTDYVVLANGGLQITLPTAVGNSNLYTVKNIGSSSVMVATTGGQTIDGQSTIIMPIQFTSVDVISDSANWEIT